jgi:hypothetical protein
MNMRIGSLRHWSPWLLALAAAAAPAPAQQDPAQQDPEAMERLRRDQEEILRKAERLHGMMQRLQQRYEREQKPEQVKLLQEGVAHLERSGLLREVAGIRDDIAASAYAEALRKQKEVVTDLERLIDILLERKSMASLDADLAQVAEQARSARELEERQRALRDRTAEAMQSPPSPGEQRLLDALQQLRDAERREADANARQAGTRRPFLESSLQRVRDLLRDQTRLEQGLADEKAGRRGEAKAREFDLGELAERTRELQAELRDQQRQLDLGAAAGELQQQAGGSDQAAVERARDALEAKLQQAPRRGGTSEGKARDPEWTALKDALRSAGSGATEAERARLQELGQKGAEVGAARAAEAARSNADAAGKLQQGAERLAERLRNGETPATAPEASPAAAVAEARQQLAEAAKAAAGGDLPKAQQATEQALAALDRARARQREQNPDADQSAARMATEARAAGQDLRNAPNAEAAEQQASDLLQAAESALRDVSEPTAGSPDAAPSRQGQTPQGQQPQPGQPPQGQQPGQPQQGQPQQGQPQQGQPQQGQPQQGQPQQGQPQQGQPQQGQPQQGQPQQGPQQGQQQGQQQPSEAQRREQSAARSRQALQQAEQALQKALEQASANSAPDMQQAAARQQELRQQAEAARQQLQQAANDGAITGEQRDKAAEQVQQAMERMQRAGERLQQGQQASASAEQQAAAEELQQAMTALDRNRPADAAQQERVQKEAEQQQKLQEDIVRLAEQLKQRQAQAAERKVQQAADAADRARRAMQQGEVEEAQQRQEEARQKLDEAAKELEQEEDRYQDLRQEELLFRMADELTTFLERQRPITAQTAEAAKSATAEGLSRAMRSKANQLGEEEQDLAGKIAALVQALTEEGNLVYQAVLKANVDDLREVARRLAGRRPDVGSFTTMLQGDVERRTEDLLAALERERQRREQERNEQQQQQQQQQQDRGRNRFNQQRKKLVSLIAELEMLKKLGVDTRTATDNLRTLVEARGDATISEAETALIERLAHRHGEITKLFQQIKAGVEETMQQMQQQEDQEPEGGRGR